MTDENVPPPPPGRARWWRRPRIENWPKRRLPLLLTVAALLLGCLIGGTVVGAVAAFSGDHRGGDRGHNSQDGRGVRGGDDHGRGDRSGGRAPAPTTSAPAPTASS